jgi:hypothetical protein
MKASKSGQERTAKKVRIGECQSPVARSAYPEARPKYQGEGEEPDPPEA